MWDCVVWSLMLPDIVFRRWEAWVYVGYTRHYVCDCISVSLGMWTCESGWMWVMLFYSLLFVSLLCVFVQRSEDVLVASKSTILLPFLLLFFYSLCVRSGSVQPLVTVLNHYTSQRVECIYFQIHHRPDRGPLGYPHLHDNHEVWQTERLISIWNTSSRGCHDYQYHCYTATAELNRWEAVLRWQGGSFRYAITAIKIFGPSGQLDAFINYFVLPENFLGRFTTT